MTELILAFLITCGSFGSYFEEEIEQNEARLTQFCGSEAWMSEPGFTEFLETADYSNVSEETQQSFEMHLRSNEGHYRYVISYLGGIEVVEGSVPDILFEDLEDNR